MSPTSITILGVTGGLGHAAALAFRDAGWSVKGFARTDRHPIQGIEFIAGNAESTDDLQRAVHGSDLVLNALNLPYHQWGNGAAEALMARTIAVSHGKTMIFPGNIYNYSATDRVITPALPQHPQTYRGTIRKAMESQLESASRAGRMRAIILRAGNFYGSPLGGDFFDQLILREARNNKVCLNPKRQIPNAWAYLPDFASAFVTLAGQRETFDRFETFHFAGHLVTANQTFAAIQKSAPHRRLKQTNYPWAMLRAIGVFSPLIRGLVEMRYIWDHELGLADPRLDAILGENFGTNHEKAISSVAQRIFG